MAYTQIKLNCDLGEELSDDTIDARVMPYIDMANIACGGHAGDHRSMSKTVQLALDHKVSLGAHPSYPDRQNFGRSTLKIPCEDLLTSLNTQVSQLASVCSQQNTSLQYIKPHGALYHDCLKTERVLSCVLSLAQSFSLPLMLLRPPQQHSRLKMLTILAEDYKVPLLWEGFADRNYDDDGQLLSRTYPNAVHDDLNIILNQAKGFISDQSIDSVNGVRLKLHCQSLCVHGDSPLAFDALKSIRALLNQEGLESLN